MRPSLQRKLQAFSLFLIALLSPVGGRAALSKTFPTSPVTVLRLECYLDVFKTIYNSSVTADGSRIVSLSTAPFTLQINPSTSTPRIIYEPGVKTEDELKLLWINEILDRDVEQYLVFPSSEAPTGWLGWCSRKSGIKIVPVPCPSPIIP